MRKTLTFLVASTALTAAVGVPAWSAMHAPADGSLGPFTALFEEGALTMRLVLASDDDDGGHQRRGGSRRGHDDDDDRKDDDDRRRGARNPAPAVKVAPPQNGLFGNSTPPQVRVN